MQQNTAINLRNLSLARYRDTVGRVVEGLGSYDQEETIAILELALAEVRLQMAQSRRVVHQTWEEDGQQNAFGQFSGSDTHSS